MIRRRPGTAVENNLENGSFSVKRSLVEKKDLTLSDLTTLFCVLIMFLTGSIFGFGMKVRPLLRSW